MIAPLFYTVMISVALVGDPQIGKTDIFNRQINDQLPTTYFPTKDIDYETKTYFNANGDAVGAQVFDTPGTWRLPGTRSASNATKLILQDMDVIIFTYGVDNKTSFAGAQDLIKQSNNLATKKKQTKVLMANKIDLPKDKWAVSAIQAQAFAKQNGLYFSMVSAKTGKNLHETFQMVIQMAAMQQDPTFK